MKTIALSNTKEDRRQPPATSLSIGALLPGSSRLPPADLAADELLLPDQLRPVPFRRLVVLLPAGEVDELALARRIWQLASACQLEVLYLALAPQAGQGYSQHRRLANLAALSAYRQVRTKTRVCLARDWQPALRVVRQPGDLLVCLAADQTGGFLQRHALAEQLARELDAPVYKLAGLQITQAVLYQGWLRNALGWVASLALLAAFFWLQIGVKAVSQPQAAILLMVLLLVAVYGLYKINTWIG